MVALQGSLLDLVADPSARVLGAHVERTVLGQGAWVDLRRAWMGGAAELLERLLEVVPWTAERRTMYDRVVDVPRLVCFYADGLALPAPALERARHALDDHYRAELGEPFCTVGLCLYRDGRDSVAWHGDTIGRGGTEDTIVAIVSLGAGVLPCGMTWARVTSSSWAAAASAPSSTPFRRRLARSPLASVSNSGPGTYVESEPRGLTAHELGP